MQQSEMLAHLNLYLYTFDVGYTPNIRHLNFSASKYLEHTTEVMQAIVNCV